MNTCHFCNKEAKYTTYMYPYIQTGWKKIFNPISKYALLNDNILTKLIISFTRKKYMVCKLCKLENDYGIYILDNNLKIALNIPTELSLYGGLDLFIKFAEIKIEEI